jgi:glycosyltransferase involved in cell wall biosynthesis
MHILLALEGPVLQGPNTWADSLYKKLNQQFSNSDEKIIEQVQTTNYKSLIKTIIHIKKFDVFHFYSESPGAALLFLLFKLLRKKTVYTVHGNITIEARYKRWPIKWLWVPAHLFVMKNVDAVTIPTKYLKSELQQYFINKKNSKKLISKQYVIPNGVNVGKYPSEILFEKAKRLKEIQTGHAHLHLLSLTSFTFQPKTMGVDLLLQTHKILNEKGIKTEIKIGGIGLQYENYKKKYQSDSIKFLGYCDAYKEYEWADVFIHLSFLDNLPIVILDAGSIGLPTIASEAGGIPEIFNSFTDKMLWGLTSNNEKIIADKIIDLIKDQSFYLDVSKKQYENIKEHFNIQTISEQFWHLYTSL